MYKSRLRVKRCSIRVDHQPTSPALLLCMPVIVTVTVTQRDAVTVITQAGKGIIITSTDYDHLQ